MQNDRDPGTFECRRCREPLAASKAAGSPVTYYRCPSCGATTSSADAGAFHRAARPLEVPSASELDADSHLKDWRRKLDAFWTHAGDTDPFARLGLSPSASLGEARDRFHALALEHHPDRGGDARALSGIIEAYDRIRDRLSQGKTVTHEPRPTGEKYVLPRRRPESWARANVRPVSTGLAKRDR